MAKKKKNSVMIELHDYSLTEQKDDRFGRVVRSQTLSEDDLVNIAVSRRTDFNATTLKASLEILKEIAMEQVVNGASVNFGLGFLNLGVTGVFIGDNATWDSSEHKLSVQFKPTSDFRKLVNTCHAEVRGVAAAGLGINTITDLSTGEVNTCLTPGGGVNLEGKIIKIAGADPEVGIKLINQADQTKISIPAASIIHNTFSKVTFILPANLPNGNYLLSVTSQFGNSGKLLKEIRSCVSESVLTVKA